MTTLPRRAALLGLSTVLWFASHGHATVGANDRWRNGDAPDAPQSIAVTVRAFAPLLTKPPPDACLTGQPSLPPPGLWSLVLNFNSASPLQGCLIVRSGNVITYGNVVTYTLVSCAVIGTNHVEFASDGERRFARFDGAGYVSCPNFDPPGTGKGNRERKNVIAVARIQANTGVRQNPLIHHPFGVGTLDAAWNMPVLSNTATSSAFETRLRMLATTRTFTTTAGMPFGSWHVMEAETHLFANTVVTHTINGVVADVFTPIGAVDFNYDPVTVTAGYDPNSKTYFLGDIDELILDPKAGKGTN